MLSLGLSSQEPLPHTSGLIGVFSPKVGSSQRAFGRGASAAGVEQLGNYYYFTFTLQTQYARCLMLTGFLL